MGDNTLSDIKSYTYFDPDHFCKTYPTKFDILLFVTIPNSDNKSNMLLFRDYTKSLPTLGRQKKIVLFKEFLDILDTKKNNKLLRNRVGGSSGLTQTPDNILNPSCPPDMLVLEDLVSLPSNDSCANSNGHQKPNPNIKDYFIPDLKLVSIFRTKGFSCH